MIWPGQNLPALELHFHLATSCLVLDPIIMEILNKQVSRVGETTVMIHLVDLTLNLAKTW